MAELVAELLRAEAGGHLPTARRNNVARLLLNEMRLIGAAGRHARDASRRAPAHPSSWRQHVKRHARLGQQRRRAARLFLFINDWWHY